MLLAILALLAAPTMTPAPSPSPTDGPLKTIVTVKSSSTCSAYAQHVNAAIADTVANDRRLGTTIVALQSTDLENNVIRRNNEIQRLEQLADQIYHSYREGEAEVNRLRDLAAKVTDPKEKADILAAANALGGALYRQHLIQRDLDGFIAFLQAGDMRRDFFVENDSGPLGQPAEENVMLIPSANDSARTIHQWWPNGQGTLNIGVESYASDVRMAGQASEDFAKRLAPLVNDEMTAGSYITSESDRC
jgi:hypothetical protein